MPELRPFPFLHRHGRNLTALALRDELVPAIGRRAEMLQVMRTLVHESNSNPVLLGEAGVAKTAMVEGLVWRIARDNPPPAL